MVTNPGHVAEHQSKAATLSINNDFAASNFAGSVLERVMNFHPKPAPLRPWEA